MRKAKLNLSSFSSEGINNLPDMQVDGEVILPFLDENKELKRIPVIGLEIGWDLVLNNCESLTSLPRGLKVDWDLGLVGCTSLTSLPKGLKVGGYLYLNGCKLLESLPQDLEVKKGVIYNFETGFTKIEGWKDDPNIIPTHLRDILMYSYV